MVELVHRRVHFFSGPLLIGASGIYDRDGHTPANEFSKAHGLNGPPLLRAAVCACSGALAGVPAPVGTPR